MTASAERQDRTKHLFIWPAFLIVLVVSLFPLIYALTVSFQTVRVVPPTPPRFVGLDNYAQIASSARFWGAIGTTALITFVSVFAQYVLGFLLALALHHNVPGASLYRVTFLLPMFLAPVGVALIARMVFHPYLGPMNDAMAGLGFAYVPFLTEKWPAIMVLAVIDIWQWTPFVALVLLAGLSTVPPEIEEAAKLETRSNWTLLRHVQLPFLVPSLVAVLILRTADTLKLFDMPIKRHS